MDVQNANRTFSQRRRVRNNFVRRGFENERLFSITIMGLRLGNIFIFPCKKNLNRQSSDRHSHFHSDENMSF